MLGSSLPRKRVFRFVFSFTAVVALCFFVITAFAGTNPSNPLSGSALTVRNATSEPVSVIREAWDHYVKLGTSVLHAEFDFFGLSKSSLDTYEKNIELLQAELHSALEYAQDISCSEPVRRLKSLWSDKLQIAESKCSEERVERLKIEAEEGADQRWSICSDDINGEGCSSEIRDRLVDFSNRHHQDVKSERNFNPGKEEYLFWRDKDSIFLDRLEEMQRGKIGPSAVQRPLRPGVGPRPEQILLLTGSDYSDSTTLRWEINERVLQNREDYCKAHGYHYEFLNFTRYGPAKDSVEHPVWLKLPALAETFERYPDVEWIWWLDMDALIMDGDLKLEEHLLHPDVLSDRMMYDRPVATKEALYCLGRAAPSREEFRVDDVNFIISHDWLTLNAGSFFIRRTKLTDIALQLWSDPSYIWDFEGQRAFERREQDAFIHMWFNHQFVWKSTAIVPQRLMNSFLSDGRWENDWTMIYEEGDFVLHFAGFNGDEEFTDKVYNVWDFVKPPAGRPLEPLPPRPEPEPEAEPEADPEAEPVENEQLEAE